MTQRPIRLTKYEDRNISGTFSEASILLRIAVFKVIIAIGVKSIVNIYSVKYNNEVKALKQLRSDLLGHNKHEKDDKI